MLDDAPDYLGFTLSYTHNSRDRLVQAGNSTANEPAHDFWDGLRQIEGVYGVRLLPGSDIALSVNDRALRYVVQELVIRFLAADMGVDRDDLQVSFVRDNMKALRRYTNVEAPTHEPPKRRPYEYHY
jgi:hypothetical protein